MSENIGANLCDIEMIPDGVPPIPCTKTAEFTMEDGTITCLEHRDLLVQEDGLEWTPGVNRGKE